MVNVNAAYKNVVENDDNHYYQVQATLYKDSGGVVTNWTAGMNEIIECEIESGIGRVNGLSYGGCFCKELTLRVQIANSLNVPSRGGKVVIEQRVVDSAGVGSAWYPMGTFFIDTRKYDAIFDIYTFVCYDAMCQLEESDRNIAEVNPKLYAQHIGQILNTNYGVIWDSNNDTILDALVSIGTLPAWYVSDLNHSMRDTMGAIALLAGGNWIISASNYLKLVTSGEHSYWSPTSDNVSDYERGEFGLIQSVTLVGNDNAYTDGDPDAIGYHIQQTLVFADQAMATNVWAVIGSDPIIPFDITFAQLPPYVEAGDTISIVIGEDTYQMPIYSMMRHCNQLMACDISLPISEGGSHEFALLSDNYK